MHDRYWWWVMALSGALMVIMGAYGAHGLDGALDAQAMSGFETAVRYQAWHSLAMLGVLAWRSALPLPGQRLVLALWAAGMLLFSGSLYGLTLTHASWLGPVTPVGGLLLILGWLALAGVVTRAR